MFLQQPLFLFMAGINEMIERLRSINMTDVVANAMQGTREELARLQREQMLAGKRSDGKKIGKYKSKKYEAKKKAQNPLAGGAVDLRLDGPFQNEIEVFIFEDKKTVVFTSNDNVPTSEGIGKTDKLVGQYGELIFGLHTPYALEYSNQYLKPEAVKIIIAKMNGKQL